MNTVFYFDKDGQIVLKQSHFFFFLSTIKPTQRYTRRSPLKNFLQALVQVFFYSIISHYSSWHVWSKENTWANVVDLNPDDRLEVEKKPE